MNCNVVTTLTRADSDTTHPRTEMFPSLGCLLALLAIVALQGCELDEGSCDPVVDSDCYEVPEIDPDPMANDAGVVDDTTRRLAFQTDFAVLNCANNNACASAVGEPGINCDDVLVEPRSARLECGFSPTAADRCISTLRAWNEAIETLASVSIYCDGDVASVPDVCGTVFTNCE